MELEVVYIAFTFHIESLAELLRLSLESPSPDINSFFFFLLPFHFVAGLSVFNNFNSSVFKRDQRSTATFKFT